MRSRGDTSPLPPIIYKIIAYSISMQQAQKLMSYKSIVDISNSYRFDKKYNVTKICRKARKVISEHDKSSFQRSAERSAEFQR